jgi:methionyl-tRNA formyltransferase
LVRVALFAGGSVGAKVLGLLRECNAELAVVVYDAAEPGSVVRTNAEPIDGVVVIAHDALDDEGLGTLLRGQSVDLTVLAWWPYLVRRHVLEAVSYGTVNLHPSLLPHGRGKDPNFWSIVERRPFGVTLHFVDEGIDSGPVIAQTELPVAWDDTGGTLYRRALEAIVELLSENLDVLLQGRAPRVDQELTAGSFHTRAELEPRSRIDLDATYTARDLLNLLRARTFPGHPGSWFEADGGRYEVRVDISRVVDN